MDGRRSHSVDLTADVKLMPTSDADTDPPHQHGQLAVVLVRCWQH